MRDGGVPRAVVTAAPGISDSTLDRNLDVVWTADETDWKARAALWCAGILDLSNGLTVVSDPTAPYRRTVALAAALAAQIVDTVRGRHGESLAPATGFDDFEHPPLTSGTQADYGPTMPDAANAAQTDGTTRRRRPKRHHHVARRYPGETATVRVDVPTYPTQKARIDRAAEARGISTGEYMRQAAELMLSANDDE